MHVDLYSLLNTLFAIPRIVIGHLFVYFESFYCPPFNIVNKKMKLLFHFLWLIIIISTPYDNFFGLFSAFNSLYKISSPDILRH